MRIHLIDWHIDYVEGLPPTMTIQAFMENDKEAIIELTKAMRCGKLIRLEVEELKSEREGEE